MTPSKSRRPEYVIWQGMKQRCYNPNCTGYESYGGRGITVCEEWRSSFDAFIRDVGPRPSRAYSIDRYPNPCGNYEPGNARWATMEEQHQNRRESRLKCGATSEEIFKLRRDGLTFPQISAKLGVRQGTAFLRCQRAGVRPPIKIKSAAVNWPLIHTLASLGAPSTVIGGLLHVKTERIPHVLSIRTQEARP